VAGGDVDFEEAGCEGLYVFVSMAISVQICFLAARICRWVREDRT
jgi:hypothetical protein